MIIKIIKELRRRIDEQSEKLEVFNKELKNIKNHQTEMKNTITEMKNIQQKESTVDYMIQRNRSANWKTVVEITEAEEKKEQK